jgi:hypothetical protein
LLANKEFSKILGFPLPGAATELDGLLECFLHGKTTQSGSPSDNMQTLLIL